MQITTLGNGMRIALDPIDGIESAAIGVWIASGARSEKASENGIAHFMEHLAFKGTNSRTARQIATRLRH